METFSNTSGTPTVSYLLKWPCVRSAVSVIALQRHSWALKVTQNIFHGEAAFYRAYT